MVKRKGQYRKKRMSKNRGKTPISKRVLRRKSTKRKVKRSKKNKRKQRGGCSWREWYEGFRGEETCDRCGRRCTKECENEEAEGIKYYYCKTCYEDDEWDQRPYACE